jgi:hypothetical protein
MAPASLVRVWSPGPRTATSHCGSVMNTGRQYPSMVSQAGKALLLSVAFVGTILLAGIGMVALVTAEGSTDTWARWSNAGQAFGVLTAVLSALALAALLVTFWLQLQELKSQRIELCQQRELLADAKSALHRSAEAELRSLHSDLTRMAIEDSELAEVWPALQPGLTPSRNRQYLYANLILQHSWLSYRLGEFTEAEMRSHLRYLFTSPLFRAFWEAVQEQRGALLVPGTDEFRFDQIAGEVFNDTRVRAVAPQSVPQERAA